MDISGKVALVTGGAYGIGKRLAEALLQKGAKGVVILDINDKNGEETLKEFETKFGSGKVVFHKCDVSSKDQMKGGFQLAKSKYGQLDIVCNNAGIWNEVEWERMFEININGVVNGTQLALENLADAGVIINVASLAGLILIPFSPMYPTTKAAILAYTRNVAKFDPTVKAKKIRLNTLCPSAIFDTNLKPKVEENVSEQFNALLETWPSITTDEVAEAFVKAIEEDLHDQVLCILTDGKGIHLAEDDTVRFRKEVLGIPPPAEDVTK